MDKWRLQHDPAYLRGVGVPGVRGGVKAGVKAGVKVGVKVGVKDYGVDGGVMHRVGGVTLRQRVGWRESSRRHGRRMNLGNGWGGWRRRERRTGYCYFCGSARESRSSLR